MKYGHYSKDNTLTNERKQLCSKLDLAGVRKDAIQRTYLSSPPPSPSNVDSFHSGGGGGCMTVAAATVAATAAAAPTE
ncbi:hypothetical protein BLOT_001236 [Blomia tropicalis]|nr:hypothetical protein BLOT_001236 [Blomia tropicalis]